eukprot:Lithocolla_globosa_v1_NODE_9373_length_714_cov_25.113809.p2 type:complete len:113 gc:universal NODE_9373_length_714_cov_25.113809:452-114(-)
MANSSCLGSLSEMSAATFHTHERSLPTLGVSCMSEEIKWFAQTLWVLSRRMTRRTLFVSRLWRNLQSPTPLSFHSLVDFSNRNSLARILNRISSSSSKVLTSTSSNLTLGSK